MSTLTSKDYWDSQWASFELGYYPHSFPYLELFDRFISPYMRGKIFEVGFFPGGYLIYFARHFAMKPYGIDFTDHFEKAVQFLEDQGLPTDGLVKGDFLEWNTPTKYDVVCSFGFVEHFRNWDYVISKHLYMCKKGGVVLIGVPRFVGIRAVFQWVFERNQFKIHNHAAMRLRNIRHSIQRTGGIVLWSGFDGTCELWVEQEPSSYVARRACNLISRQSKRLENKLHFPNPIFSPFGLVVARKDR